MGNQQLVDDVEYKRWEFKHLNWRGFVDKFTDGGLALERKTSPLSQIEVR